MLDKQRLELNWIGKNKPEYNITNIEPRILIEDIEKSYGDSSTENMLIHGDNLLALKALEQEYTGEVKCIYIDPPYNTGNAFEHYDDNLEHSIWLSLMKPRLEILRNLLKEDGVIAVQIGFDEMAYLKVLMDEIFGRKKCIGQVAVRMSHSAGMKRKAADKRMIKNTEYILLYYKDIQPEIKPIYEVTHEYPVNYYQYILEYPSKSNNNIGKYTKLLDIVYNKFEIEFNRYNLNKNNNSIRILYGISDDFKDFIMENKDKIVRKDSNVPAINNVTEDLDINEFVEYKTDNETYYIGINSAGNYYQIYSLEDKVQEINFVDDSGTIIKKEAIANLIGDWWDGFYKDMSRVDIEGGVKMKTSKKPERLISWVLESITKENDLVLDSFLGSGTTVAVAHKMKRRWIGIELGEHCYTHCIPRLKRVTDGEDTGGITKIVNWQGGGGFKFYELSPSLLKKDVFNNWIIDDNYNADMLAAAVCKHEGFIYSPNIERYWKQGQSTEMDYIFVTTNLITVEYLDKIYEEMKEDESLLICCKSYQDICENKYNNITIKKIPQGLLNRCEFGRESYNLNIISLPEYEE